MEIGQGTTTTYKSDMVLSHKDAIPALRSARWISCVLMAESQWNSRGHSEVCHSKEQASRLGAIPDNQQVY